MLVQYRYCKHNVLVDASVMCAYYIYIHIIDIYVCMVSTFSTVEITGYACQSCLWSPKQGNMSFSLSPFAPENLVSRDGFGPPVSLQPAHSSPLSD